MREWTETVALAVALAVLGTGLMDIGDYEEKLKFCRRGTELARKTQYLLVLWLNLDSLGQACGACLIYGRHAGFTMGR